MATTLHTEARTKWQMFCRQHFQMHFLERTVLCIWILISLMFLPCGLIDQSALFQEMAWHWRGNKPLPKPMMTQFNDKNICITRSQWVNCSLIKWLDDVSFSYYTFIPLHFSAQLLLYTISYIILYVISYVMTYQFWYNSRAHKPPMVSCAIRISRLDVMFIFFIKTEKQGIFIQYISFNVIGI